MYCNGAVSRHRKRSQSCSPSRAVLAQGFDYQGDRAVLLTDGHVEALHASVLLVDDRIDGHSVLPVLRSPMTSSR